MEKEKNNILGCFLSYGATLYDSKESEKLKSKEQGDLFKNYLWGENGISNKFDNLNFNRYGEDLKLALFEFYLNPLEFEVENLKGIEPFRKKEKSIGIPIIVNDENFFNQTEEGRYAFLKKSILDKMDLLNEVVKKKKLDTNMSLLISDLEKVLSEFWN